jgi:hypothetical protein
VSLEQVQKVVADSVASDYRWDVIAITGGEPPLHPDLVKIAEVLAAYKREANPGVVLICLTNGFQARSVEIVNEIEKRFPLFIIRNSAKTGSVQPSFFPVMVAPRDYAPDWYKTQTDPGCKFIEMCGVSYNYNGFYPCGNAASMDRVLKIGGIKELRDLTPEALRELRREFCQWCSVGMPGAPRNDGRVTLISESWLGLLKDHPAWKDPAIRLVEKPSVPSRRLRRMNRTRS